MEAESEQVGKSWRGGDGELTGLNALEKEREATPTDTQVHEGGETKEDTGKLWSMTGDAAQNNLEPLNFKLFSAQTANL